MKDRPDAILRPQQAAYLARLLPPREALLAEMEVHAERDGIPISDPEIGRVLGILARGVGARRILEIGTAIGYGTLCLARGAIEARVTSIDRDPVMLAAAAGYLERGEVLDRVELVEGEALETLGRMIDPGGSYDLIYLDGDKQSYRRCLDFSLQLLRVGGLVVIDNLLWKGQVADPGAWVEGADADDETQAETLAAFNGYLMMHPQLEAVVLPLGDGLGIAAKTRPLVTDLGGPY